MTNGDVVLDRNSLTTCYFLFKFVHMQRAADFTSRHIHLLPKTDGLVPTFMSMMKGTFRAGSALSVGASADSYYEYLLKQWIQTGKTRQWLVNIFHAYDFVVRV